MPKADTLAKLVELPEGLPAFAILPVMLTASLQTILAADPKAAEKLKKIANG